MGWEWLVALVALTAMEIVLGIDNIVFIAILTDRLPENQQAKARRCGLGVALVMRILLLLTLSWILGMTKPVFVLSDLGLGFLQLADEVNEVSFRDLILLGGGLFLIGKSVHEIHAKFEGGGDDYETSAGITFTGVLIQISILDVVFSLDSVITAVGMANQLWVMIIAVILAAGVMLVFAEKVSGFVKQHATLKMLALNFLLLIGVMLMAEGIGTHINKGYIYFAMVFALFVEFLNLKVAGKAASRETA